MECNAAKSEVDGVITPYKKDFTIKYHPKYNRVPTRITGNEEDLIAFEKLLYHTEGMQTGRDYEVYHGITLYHDNSLANPLTRGGSPIPTPEIVLERRGLCGGK